MQKCSYINEDNKKCNRSRSSSSKYCKKHKRRIIIKRVNKSVTIISLLIGIIGLYFGISSEIKYKKDKRISATSGKLKSKTIWSNKKGVYPKIKFGPTGDVLEDIHYVYNFRNRYKPTDSDFNPTLAFLKDSFLDIELENNEIKVSTVVRNKHGEIIAVLNKNEWMVNEDNILDRNYSDSALEIINEFNEVALQIVIENEIVQFQGTFYDSEGYSISFQEPIENDGSKAVIGFFAPDEEIDESSKMKIKPIFKYPSALHLGELVDN